MIEIPEELRARAARWGEMKRWERRELGQELRQLGLSYREITAIIPVPKGTLSHWCRDIALDPQQEARLRLLRPEEGVRRAVGARRRQAALERTRSIRTEAVREARSLAGDPKWVAGVVAYWAEGAKRSNEVQFSNSDPALVKLFVSWAHEYLAVDVSRLSLQLHLHTGQCESERKLFWSDVTGVGLHRFQRTFIKPEGTGHRKNILYQGTVQIRISRSTDLLHRITGWIQAVGNQYTGTAEAPLPYNALLAGR